MSVAVRHNTARQYAHPLRFELTALPRPALPCPALPGPALPCPVLGMAWHQSVAFMTDHETQTAASALVMQDSRTHQGITSEVKLITAANLLFKQLVQSCTQARHC